MTLLHHTIVLMLWMGCTTYRASAGAACEDPPIVDFGDIVSGNKSAYKESDRVQYVCNPGYTLSGSEWVTCFKKIWVPGPPKCLAPCTITRQQLEAQNLLLSNGQRRAFLIQSGQWEIFACETGFKLTASPIKQCFDGHIELPSCISDVTCGAAPEIPHAHITSTQQERYLPGARVHFECESNFQMMGGNYVTCTNGEWSQAPTCRDVTCKPPPEIAGGKVHGVKKSRYLPGESARYQCWRGFEMSGAPTAACRNGTWTELPTCTGKGGKCGSPPVIENGDLLSFPMQEYPEGAALEYKCPDFYVLEGSPSITCTNGQWTSPPVCLVACTASEEDMGRNNIELKWTGGSKLYSRSGDFVEFRCKRGYMEDPASSPFRVECLEGTLEYPQCKPAMACTASEEDMGRNNIELKWTGGSKLYSRSGDFIEFQCKRGYMEDPVSSPFRVECLEGTLEYPRCKPARDCRLNERLMETNHIRLQSSSHPSRSTFRNGEYILFECKWLYQQVSHPEKFRAVCRDGVITYPTCEYAGVFG